MCIFWVVIHFLPTPIEEGSILPRNVCVIDELVESQRWWIEWHGCGCWSRKTRVGVFLCSWQDFRCKQLLLSVDVNTWRVCLDGNNPQCWTNNGTNDVWSGFIFFCTVTSLYTVTQCACTYSDTIRNAGSKYGRILRKGPPGSPCWINILVENDWSTVSTAVVAVFHIFCTLEGGWKMSPCRSDTLFRQLLKVEARLSMASTHHSCCRNGTTCTFDFCWWSQLVSKFSPLSNFYTLENPKQRPLFL